MERFSFKGIDTRQLMGISFFAMPNQFNKKFAIFFLALHY